MTTVRVFPCIYNKMAKQTQSNVVLDFLGGRGIFLIVAMSDLVYVTNTNKNSVVGFWSYFNHCTVQSREISSNVQ